MKLSIFLEPNPLPKNKEEKVESAKKAIQPEIVEINDTDDLIRVVTSYCWSPFVFNGTRKQSNFKSVDFAVLDIDEGLPIDEADRIITDANMTCLCVPTTSHTGANHRYRLVFPLVKTITDVEVYKATMLDLFEAFPMADPSCITDSARLFFSSTMDDGFWFEGDLLEPVSPPEKLVNTTRREFDPSMKVRVDVTIEDLIKDLYGASKEHIPEVVDYFLKNASTGLNGTWVTTLNSFVFTLSLQGIEFDVIYDLVKYLAPNELDKRDITTIERAFADGERERS